MAEPSKFGATLNSGYFRFLSISHSGEVGSKSHCRAAPAVPCPICCTSNLIFINYVSLKPYVSHIYFTVVNKTKIVFCSKLCFY